MALGGFDPHYAHGNSVIITISKGGSIVCVGN